MQRPNVLPNDKVFSLFDRIISSNKTMLGIAAIVLACSVFHANTSVDIQSAETKVSLQSGDVLIKTSLVDKAYAYIKESDKYNEIKKSDIERLLAVYQLTGSPEQALKQASNNAIPASYQIDQLDDLQKRIITVLKDHPIYNENSYFSM